MLVIDKTNRIVYIVSMQSTDISPQKSRRSAGPLRSTQSKTAILQAAIQVAHDDGYAAASIEKLRAGQLPVNRRFTGGTDPKPRYSSMHMPLSYRLSP